MDDRMFQIYLTSKVGLKHKIISDAKYARFKQYIYLKSEDTQLVEWCWPITER